MRRALIRGIGGCVVLAVILGASSRSSGEPLTPTPDAAANPYKEAIGAYQKATIAYAAATTALEKAATQGVMLKLDPETQKAIRDLAAAPVKTLAEREGTVPATPERERVAVDPWQNPAFQTLMSTLWQAPLVILAIVLAIAGIVGWQGYQDVKEKLFRQLKEENEQLKIEVAHSANMAIASGQLDAAWYSWALALDLLAVGKNPNETRTDVLTAKRKLLTKEVPLRFDEAPSALSHVRFAKDIVWQSIKYFDQIPSGLNLRTSNRPIEYLEWEAKQTYAYYVAADADKAEYDEWQSALRFSDSALKLSENTEWLKDEPKIDKAVVRGSWTDTFIYVRVLFYWKKKQENLEGAERELAKAEEVYKRAVANYPKIKSRFESVLTDDFRENPVNEVQKRRRILTLDQAEETDRKVSP